jgi:hypothetical protein
MTNLGPAPAPALQPMRPGDREPRERPRPAVPHKVSPVSSLPDPDLETVAEIDQGEEAHQLDERA